MARGPSHRLGQLIGEILELALEPLLAAFAKEHGLYLDKKGGRQCRKGRKCTWLDRNGNKHDLDFVLERGGTAEKVGMPAAFIETAWRRHTKHSRNKAQEIQGAIAPLVETFMHVAPFTGAVLAGDFTNGALTQLKSLGFTVLYLPYESVMAVFRTNGIDAAYEEGTPDAEAQKKVDAVQRMSNRRKRSLAAKLLAAHQTDVDHFVKSLTTAVSRQIERILVLPLHGKAADLTSIDDAVDYIQTYGEGESDKPFDRYEVQIRYNNGDRIEGSFRDKETAIKHLRSFQPVPAKVG